MAQVFGELAVEVAIDCGAGLIDLDCRRRFVLSARRRRNESCQTT